MVCAVILKGAVCKFSIFCFMPYSESQGLPPFSPSRLNSLGDEGGNERGMLNCFFNVVLTPHLSASLQLSFLAELYWETFFSLGGRKSVTCIDA